MKLRSIIRPGDGTTCIGLLPRGSWIGFRKTIGYHDWTCPRCKRTGEIRRVWKPDRKRFFCRSCKQNYRIKDPGMMRQWITEIEFKDYGPDPEREPIKSRDEIILELEERYKPRQYKD